MSVTSVEEAAAAIVQLINSSPRSPRQDEIEAIVTAACRRATLADVASVLACGDYKIFDAVRGQMTVLPELSAEHLEYRELVAEIARFNEPGFASDDEGDAALGRLQDQAMELERKIWATPASTLADVLLRGEIALYNENGILDNLDDPDALYDERANAQLIRAVVDVLGGGHYASR